MELGLVLAVLSAASFAVSNIFVRKGTVHSGEAFTSVILSVFVGMFLFTVLVGATSEWKALIGAPWVALVMLAIAGIMHFFAGRLLGYSAIRLLGANKASVFIKSQIFYPVIFGVMFLDESLSIPLIVGVVFIVIGATFVGSEKKSRGSTADSPALRAKGIMAALGGALFWGSSGVLIKPAVAQIGSPYAGALVSYTAATLVVAVLLLNAGQREKLITLAQRSAVLLATGGVFAALAQLLRFVALDLSPVSLVGPLQSTSTVFIVIFSFMMNRSQEVFTWKVVAGIAVTMLGAFMFSF